MSWNLCRRPSHSEEALTVVIERNVDKVLKMYQHMMELELRIQPLSPGEFHHFHRVQQEIALAQFFDLCTSQFVLGNSLVQKEIENGQKQLEQTLHVQFLIYEKDFEQIEANQKLKLCFQHAIDFYRDQAQNLSITEENHRQNLLTQSLQVFMDKMKDVGRWKPEMTWKNELESEIQKLFGYSGGKDASEEIHEDDLETIIVDNNSLGEKEDVPQEQGHFLGKRDSVILDLRSTDVEQNLADEVQERWKEHRAGMFDFIDHSQEQCSGRQITRFHNDTLQTLLQSFQDSYVDQVSPKLLQDHLDKLEEKVDLELPAYLKRNQTRWDKLKDVTNGHLTTDTNTDLIAM